MLSQTALALRKYFPSFRKIVFLAILYALLSFAYSAIGFLHPQVPPHYHEYAGFRLLTEIVGHFSFGFVAAVPLFDLRLALLTGAGAVLIDSDHLLSDLNFNVGGRPDHSLLFIVVSTTIMLLAASRYGTFRKDFLAKFAFVASIVLFSHISYDIFAGGGSSFQLLIPFSFEEFTFPFQDWIVFEAIAIVISSCGYLYSRQLRERGGLG